MIRLTKLNKRAFVLNSEQIKTIEETPDTLITLLNGDQILVLEPMSDVVRQAIEYGREIRTFQPFNEPPPESKPASRPATGPAPLRPDR